MPSEVATCNPFPEIKNRLPLKKRICSAYIDKDAKKSSPLVFPDEMPSLTPISSHYSYFYRTKSTDFSNYQLDITRDTLSLAKTPKTPKTPKTHKRQPKSFYENLTEVERNERRRQLRRTLYKLKKKEKSHKKIIRPNRQLQSFYKNLTEVERNERRRQLQRLYMLRKKEEKSQLVEAFEREKKENNY